METRRSEATDLGTWAARRPDAEAVVIVDPDATRPAERITYGALNAAANRLARALRRAGLRRGDRVAFVLGNEPGVFTVFWAAMRTGLHVVPVNRHLLAGEIRYILEDATVSAVIGSPAGGPAWPEAADGLSDMRLTLTVGDTLEAALAAEAADPVPDAEEGQLLLYSSGTTGRPKGILRPLPGFGPGQGPTTGSEIAAGFGLVAGDRYLSTGPLYHSAPLAFSAAQQRIGATAVVMTLLDHPAVDDAAVVGVDDPDLGQRAVAVVVPAAGVRPDPALAETLLAHCREHLARYKCPRDLRFRSELPRSEAGKIVKGDLRRALEDGEA